MAGIDPRISCGRYPQVWHEIYSRSGFSTHTQRTSVPAFSQDGAHGLRTGRAYLADTNSVEPQVKPHKWRAHVVSFLVKDPVVGSPRLWIENLFSHSPK